MGTSAYSKGKGGRRFPGRDGGGRKGKKESWESRSSHSIDRTALLGEKIVTLSYTGPWGKDASERIYLLDQAFADADIKYAVEVSSREWRLSFSIFVLDSCRLKAADIINKLEKMYRPSTQPQRVQAESIPQHRETLKVIIPENLPVHLKDNLWEFAIYTQYDNQRSYLSDMVYRALIFRNINHTVYGIKEWDGNGAPLSLNKMARRIVVDDEFRQSLITEDPKVPEIWEKLGELADS